MRSKQEMRELASNRGRQHPGNHSKHGGKFIGERRWARRAESTISQGKANSEIETRCKHSSLARLVLLESIGAAALSLIAFVRQLRKSKFTRTPRTQNQGDWNAARCVRRAEMNFACMALDQFAITIFTTLCLSVKGNYSIYANVFPFSSQQFYDYFQRRSRRFLDFLFQKTYVHKNDF